MTRLCLGDDPAQNILIYCFTVLLPFLVDFPRGYGDLVKHGQDAQLLFFYVFYPNYVTQRHSFMRIRGR